VIPPAPDPLDVGVALNDVTPLDVIMTPTFPEAVVRPEIQGGELVYSGTITIDVVVMTDLWRAWGSVFPLLYDKERLTPIRLS
jgi:hypothetical protein